jgi:hypothetical protein
LFGKNDRRFAYAVAMTSLAAAFAFPAVAAAEPAEEGAVVESLAPSHQGPWSHWTQQRLEEAEPLPVVTLPYPEAPVAGPEATVTGEPAPTTTSTEDEDGDGDGDRGEDKGARTAALRAATASQTGAVEGIEVTAAESNLPPNSANGRLFGTYEKPIGNHEFVPEYYSCSASVVKPPPGITSASNVVVTAGHCVIEPATGTKTNTEMIFMPGYRNGAAPYGAWKAEFFTTTEAWKNTAKAGSRPNEGSDVAFVGLAANSENKAIEKVVGSLGIGFDQVCNQTYTQFGYPADWPYNGELLYSHTTAYAGADTIGGFLPVPLKIASDFTRGSSGGPWAVGIGTGSPTVLSVTAYGYESQPGYLYGPYFGEAAKKAYGAAFGKILPAGIEETCAELPAPPPIVTTTPPVTTPPVTEPPKETVTPPKQVSLKVTRVRRLANGSAVLTAKVNAAGMLKLSGTAVRAESLDTPAAGQYRMVVAAKGVTNRRLRQVGKAKVGVSVAFSASGKTKRVTKKIALSRPAVARAAQQRAAAQSR